MHFAAFCPPYASHLHAFSALAGGLVARGHRVTFLLPEGSPLPRTGQGVEVIHVGITSSCGGDQGRAIARSADRTDLLCRNAGRVPAVDAVLGDQMEPAAGLIAAYLGLPLVSVACALPLEAEPGIPLPFLGWPYDPSPRGLKRNRGGERVARLILHRQNAAISHWAGCFGIGPRNGMADCLSPFLTLSQTLPGFDFPRSHSSVVETGPLRRADFQEFPADIEPDPARPFVYASLGTVQGHRAGILRKIAAACRSAGAQLLVSHSGGLTAQEADSLGATWVRDHVPQEAVLDRVDLCITHAGLNTAMEALARGVPMLAIPVAFDQPGVAARLVHHGVALRHSRHWLRTDALTTSIRRLLEEPGFRNRARAFGHGPGVPLAVSRIEAALTGAQSLVAAQ
ncbi:glycosyltransferase [Falsirhodobacter deserti]|uniref:glycosyltransferase n=1 Tax=Falsirhodobacter deserti TaxID=1365611 RepID=UPI0013E3C5CE|nr:glycosyltransferase [Falsirhodobacter deserti]